MALLDKIFATGVYQRLLHGGRDYTEHESRDVRTATGKLLVIANPDTVATPVISLASGSYVGSQTTEITCADTGAQIYYSYGSDLDNANGTLYTGELTVPNGTFTLTAVARKLGKESSAVATATYSIVAMETVATPTLSHASGQYPNGTRITISCSTPGASIYYTDNGSEPTRSNGSLYRVAIDLPSDSVTVIKAFAYKSDMLDSGIVTGSYIVSDTPAETISDPVFDPAAGTICTGTTVAISSTTADAIIRYTVNGTNPSPTTGTLYTGAITLALGSHTIKAIAYKSAALYSNVVTAAYTVVAIPDVLPPEYSHVSSVYYGDTEISITCATAGASIYYALGLGSVPDDPDENTGTLYTGAITITTGTSYFKAMAYKAGSNSSSVVSRAFGVIGGTDDGTINVVVVVCEHEETRPNIYATDYDEDDEGTWTYKDRADDIYQDLLKYHAMTAAEWEAESCARLTEQYKVIGTGTSLDGKTYTSTNAYVPWAAAMEILHGDSLKIGLTVAGLDTDPESPTYGKITNPYTVDSGSAPYGYYRQNTVKGFPNSGAYNPSGWTGAGENPFMDDGYTRSFSLLAEIIQSGYLEDSLPAAKYDKCVANVIDAVIVVAPSCYNYHTHFEKVQGYSTSGSWLDITINGITYKNTSSYTTGITRDIPTIYHEMMHKLGSGSEPSLDDAYSNELFNGTTVSYSGRDYPLRTTMSFRDVYIYSSSGYTASAPYGLAPGSACTHLAGAMMYPFMAAGHKVTDLGNFITKSCSTTIAAMPDNYGHIVVASPNDPTQLMILTAYKFPVLNGGDYQFVWGAIVKQGTTYEMSGVYATVIKLIGIIPTTIPPNNIFVNVRYSNSYVGYGRLVNSYMSAAMTQYYKYSDIDGELTCQRYNDTTADKEFVRLLSDELPNLVNTGGDFGVTVKWNPSDPGDPETGWTSDGEGKPLANVIIIIDHYVATPDINYPDGEHESPITVELNCATDPGETTIYYEMTTDESEPADPTTASTEYNPATGISITESSVVRIKARAYYTAWNYSEVVSATYTIT